MPLPALAVPAALKGAEMFMAHRAQQSANRKSDRAAAMDRVLQGLGQQGSRGTTGAAASPSFAQQMVGDPLVQNQITSLVSKLFSGDDAANAVANAGNVGTLGAIAGEAAQQATAWSWPDGRPVTPQEANDPSISMAQRQTWIRTTPFDGRRR